MTRRPMQLPSLLLIVAGGLAVLALVGVAGSPMAPTVATAHPQTLTGAIPGPPTAATTTPVIATDWPRSVPGVSQSTRTVYRTLTGRTAVSTAYVAAPTRTVFATRTATATVTAVQTVTATATQTVTVTTTAAPPALTAGSTP